MITWVKALKNVQEVFSYEEVMDNFDTLCERPQSPLLSVHLTMLLEMSRRLSWAKLIMLRCVLTPHFG